MVYVIDGERFRWTTVSTLLTRAGDSENVLVFLTPLYSLYLRFQFMQFERAREACIPHRKKDHFHSTRLTPLTSGTGEEKRKQVRKRQFGPNRTSGGIVNAHLVDRSRLDANRRRVRTPHTGRPTTHSRRQVLGDPSTRNRV